MKKDNIKKGDISVEQIIKVVIFIAVLVIVFLGTSYLYGKEINWLSWLPGFDSTKTPTGIYMIRYDTASRGVQSYDGATWEDFENDVNTGQGIFNLGGELLTDIALRRDFEGFYYGEGEKNAPKRFKNNWFYVLGFDVTGESYSEITPYPFMGKTGYVVAREYTNSINIAMPENRRFGNRYFIFTAEGEAYYKDAPKTCCNGVGFSNEAAKFDITSSSPTSDKCKIVVSENVMNGEPDISANTFITKDVVEHLKRIDGIEVDCDRWAGFSSKELIKNKYNLIDYGTGIVQLFYFGGNDKLNGEPVDIWFERRITLSQAAGVELKETFNYFIWTVNYKLDTSYTKWDSLNGNIDDKRKFVEDWKKSILVKPIKLSSFKDGEVSPETESFKYYCGKLYDGRYIVVDLGIEVKEKDVCGGNLT